MHSTVACAVRRAVRVQRRVMKRVEELSLLYTISQLLEQSLDLNQVVQPIIETISSDLNLLHCSITLLDRGSNEITTEAATGLSRSQRTRGTYLVGEGITGEVVASGVQKIIPDIGSDAQFLDRIGISKVYPEVTISFICIPVKLNTETIGTLSAHLPAPAPAPASSGGESQGGGENGSGGVALEESAQLLGVIAAMIAQAVRLRRDFIEERRILQAENTRLQEALVERFRPANIIGNSAKMQGIFDMVAQVCRSDATVLIRGESGTGKELIAQAIHYNSFRKNHPFVRVNCAALPENIIESELFGHEKGAFTGATGMRKGRFELANNGSIFLDEIGDLSWGLQAKLLRVLQEREFERVGGNETIRCNVRVIAATNHNLEEQITSKRFREDLYYRLNVFPLHIPPLRERKSDIVQLADHFVAKYGKQNNKKILRLSTPAIDMLTAYHWPGNVRELENCIERSVLLSTDGVIYGQHLPPSLQSAEYTNTGVHDSLQEAVDAVEREKIIEALKSTKGNMSRAAGLLRITNRQMGLRVEKYGIQARKYR